MNVRISQVDAFTDRKYSGNPAAVCILSEPADERWMQDVAAEMNLSETAFAQRLGPDAIFHLRPGLLPKRKLIFVVTPPWPRPISSGRKDTFPIVNPPGSRPAAAF